MTLRRRLDETRGAAPARGSIARRSQVGQGPHAPGPPLPCVTRRERRTGRAWEPTGEDHGGAAPGIIASGCRRPGTGSRTRILLPLMATGYAAAWLLGAWLL